MRKGTVRRLLITVGCLILGTVLTVYPFLSNYLYEHRQEQVIFQYQQEVSQLDSPRLEAAYAEAEDYNRALRDSHFTITEPFDPESVKSGAGSTYSELLNLSGDGLMGYVEIPSIEVYLPIYHGTSDYVLQNGVGHLENTSLPIGGEGTHTVLSAHSGLSDKKLFTDLILLEEGDVFYLHVLDRTLAYQVDQIQTVLPYETESLQIVSGQDYVTLVTCTPYGVNSHRLLVRGRSIPYVPEEKGTAQPLPRESQDSPWMRQYVQAVAVGTLVLVLVLVAVGILSRRRAHE